MQIENRLILSQNEVFKLNEAQLLLKKAMDIVKAIEVTKSGNPQLKYESDPIRLLQRCKGSIQAAGFDIDNAIRANTTTPVAVFTIHYLKDDENNS